MHEPLSKLGYFTEWGGRNWEALVRCAISELQRNDCLNGSDLLEIGARYGKMSVLFALLGARVTGVDISEASLIAARKEASKWKAPNVNFLAYNGDLDLFSDNRFDVVFTKSVLVVVPNLERFLRKISMKLRPNGRVIFIENGRGNFLIHKLRCLRHQKWNYRLANYFTRTHARLVDSIFEIEITRRTVFPPVWMFLGRKRA